MRLRYFSVCSGIEAASVAWQPLGWEAVGFSEISPHAIAVLEHHFPTIPNYGNFTAIDTRNLPTIDLVVGGTPCQGFSAIGKRRGLDDSRSQLAIAFVEFLAAVRPRWFVWENVPGVFSSNDGADFREFLGALSGRRVPQIQWRNAGIVEGIPNAYSLAWRVLDAQHFGVPQRRRRVFVVGYLGADWRSPAAVLFERESLCGDFATCRQTRSPVAPCLTARVGKSLDSTAECYVFSCKDYGQDARADGLVPTLRAGEHRHSHANSGIAPAIANSDGVRRLTPVECERLMGFPDNWTSVPWRGGTMPDGPRYKLLGNSIAVPVLKWIGDRISRVEAILQNSHRHHLKAQTKITANCLDAAPVEMSLDKIPC